MGSNCANHHLLIKTVPGTLEAKATIAIHEYPLRDSTQTICLSLSRQPERDACVAVMGGEWGFLGPSRVRGFWCPSDCAVV